MTTSKSHGFKIQKRFLMLEMA